MLAKLSKRKGLKGNKNEDLTELWSEIRNKNPEAISRLYCLSYPWLFSYGYEILSKKEFVRDAIQELFLRLWKKQDTINEAKSVKFYLFSSLRRIIFRRLKKQSNRKDRNHSYQENNFEAFNNIEEVIIHFEAREEKKNKLESAIDSLSDRQKEAIHLRYYSGLSNTEIANLMNINKQSVYNHVSKAINKMQNVVQ